MAVVKQPFSCSLKLRYQKGVNANGDPVYVNRTYQRVKLTAGDQAIYEVAQAISSLQAQTLLGVYRVDDGELINQ
ncbi:DUF1659 domain-containing protein [Desulforamulus hydrothermalis]|uniref:DUF1659 domain-containing protein n=1 Tax=Desulforamulus hydrothermalis Lam5 = DSM 18033 TaxID=1121428 RepID=K8EFY1_9FIRM|nr:DUF1659 domain-containing protein [Desulforamulus hydrothermalis]CCO07601.1 conserved hypothetical protein [Desulforamulus hydrothermalis Lam5 = DSM 18033]SHH20149.1 Protein of unknown function [Desulforamulus hydrothermalis Lam5 = DSM 18033]